jgi:hypothetical protein
MACEIAIDFDVCPNEFSLVHRVRNFGESLYRVLLENGWASISLADIDKATNQLRVAVRSSRKVRRLSSLIEELLDRHGLVTIARLSRITLGKRPMQSVR